MILNHHVVLMNGRDDIVCSCGEHFRTTVLNASVSYEPTDAIRQWVSHYNQMPNAEDVAANTRIEMKRIVEGWFTNISLDDMFDANGWRKENNG